MTIRILLLALPALGVADAQPTPLDTVALPPPHIVARYATRDVVLETAFAADGTLLSWRCAVTPHPSLCTPTAAVADWAGAPTRRRGGAPDLFRLPVAFWMPADYDRDAPGAAPLAGEPPTHRYARRLVTEPDLFPSSESQPVLLGGLQEVHSRARFPPALVADTTVAEGRAFVQLVVDERGRVLDTEASPIVCARAPHAGLCEAARDIVRPTRWIPGRLRGVPVRVRFTLPLRYCRPGGAAPATRSRACS